jgi:molecular chaperone DnaK
VPQVEVTFDIDANGIVNVSAKDKATNKEQQIRIQASGGLSDDEIKRMVKDAELNATEDKRRRELAEARNQAEALINATEKTLSENADKVAEADKAAIEAEIKALRTALEGQDAGEIKAKIEDLTKASFKLGEAMYKAEGDAGGDAGSEDQAEAAHDNVVDADFEEVDDKKRKGAH